MKLAPYEHAQTGPDGPAMQKTVDLPPQFVNKVVDVRGTMQRQSPTVQVEMRRSSRDVSDSIQRQSGGYQLYKGEQMPQVQSHRVKQNQNPSPESSEEERDTLNQAARAWKHRVSPGRDSKDHPSRLD